MGMEGQSREHHIVALSGGKDSTAMSLRLQEVEPRDYLYVCTPTGDELPDMVEHWKRLERVLGANIIQLRAKHDLNGWIEFWNALPNGRMRWCTRVLKIEPFQAFVKRKSLDGTVTVYVGLRGDEPKRRGSVYSVDVKQRFPMREWGWNVGDVWKYLSKKNIRIPKRTDCARCFFQRLGEWWETWNNHPAIYASAEKQEADTGFTFRRKDRDSQPTGLKELREKFESGYIPKILPHPQDDPGLQQQELFDEETRCRVCEL
ncbi:MAG: phosphoadenosine phosphosulfate reductase family protein [Nitrospinae bacterium]|nr:phosphoadenosine phosphosulfate reductase family protein [Nitrospinota bacterium]